MKALHGRYVPIVPLKKCSLTHGLTQGQGPGLDLPGQGPIRLTSRPVPGLEEFITEYD